MTHLRKVVLCLTLALSLFAGLRADAGELILLLAGRPETPRPEDVVDRVRRGQPLAGGLGAGNPTGGRLLIPHRDRRRPADADPESAEQLLLRYVVLSYPAVVDLDALQRALERNPHVLSVSPNREFHVSLEPNDPLFPRLDSLGNPRPADQHQWGSHFLRLPGAWDYNKGHAYVAVIDHGLDTTHPDLRAFHQQGTTWIYDGGNFRPQLSFDYGYPNESPNSVDQGQPGLDQDGVLRTPNRAGHGTHVSGIVAARADNATGVAGACWHCSLIMSKVSRLRTSSANTVFADRIILQSDVVAGINGAIQKGAQVLNLSFGYRSTDNPPAPDCQANPLDSFCVALQTAQNRDVVIAAAVGNDFSPEVDFPASDSRTIAVGGITSSGSFWNDCAAPGNECGGSNYSPEQVVAPAKQILSTFYRGLYYAGAGSTCPGFTDFGLCTGTSMASPYVAGSAGVLRSVNPLLSKENVKTLLRTNLENPPGWNPQYGYGKPHMANAAKAALGKVGGSTIPNRLTPLFSLYSSSFEDYFYTAVPQMAASAILLEGYLPVGPYVPGYEQYPGVGPCQVGPCIPQEPTASVYVFTGHREPFTGAAPLVPLYRLSRKSTNPNGNANHRDITYTTEATGLVTFKGLGYELDGIEGYIHPRCTPEPSCIPAGAVRLYRQYDPNRDDFAVFPESERPLYASYGSRPGFNDWIGYVYPNADSDFDNLINGFEGLVGTNPAAADNDCDGLNDGQELLTFGASGYGDPNKGPCNSPIFADVPTGHWAKRFVEAIYFAGLTGGCALNPRSYCPNDSVSRAQAAVFLIAAKGPAGYVPPPCTPLFNDVPCTHYAAPWIDELARRGITSGCGGGSFCPDPAVDRGTMAYFLLRTLGIPVPTTCTGMFSDVPCSVWYAPWVEELARRGITAGCGNGQYCPTQPVSRASMAVFLVGTFGIPLP